MAQGGVRAVAVILGSLFFCLGWNGLESKALNSILFKRAHDPTSEARARIDAEFQARRTYLRRAHAQELLGTRYQKSEVRLEEKLGDPFALDSFVGRWTRRALHGKWKNDSDPISQAILRESSRYGFDPIFILAIIERESSFNPEAIGKFGEIGLMQLTSETGQWIAKRSGYPWHGKASLKDPIINIQLGTAYLAYLREELAFHSQLYISAYNMGLRNLRRAIERRTWSKTYSSRVLASYLRFYKIFKQTLGRPY